MSVPSACQHQGRGTIKAGWFLLADEAEFIWEAPQPLQREVHVARSPKSVLMFPPVMDYEARLLQPDAARAMTRVTRTLSPNG